MELEDINDILSQQPDYPSKSPKRIDRWTYEKIESLLREQIRNLKDENFSLREQIRILTTVETKIEQAPVIIYKAPEPVGQTLSVAQMEQIERENYWKAEIKRREEALKEPQNTNTIEVEK